MPASDVFHYQGLTYWGPLRSQRVEHVLDLLALEPKERILDLGCGRAEIALRMVQRFGVHALAVDRSEHALAEARAAAAERRLTANIEFSCADARAFAEAPGSFAGSFAAVTCLGGPRVADSLGASWRIMLGWLRPGGYLITGEGFWRCTPASAYLAATGIAAGDLLEHWRVIEAAREIGARVLFSCVSSRAEWDEFEGRILYNTERYAADHAQDPDVPAMVARRRTFYDAQQRWGRDTMGFGLYLLQKP